MRGHFSRAGIDAEPDTASVTFLGVERMDVMRFGPDPDGVARYVSLGCSRHPMTDPASIAADPLRGPRAEIVMTCAAAQPPGLARSLAVIAATPAVEGVVLVPDALVDLSAPLWEAAAFTAVLLGGSDIPDLTLPAPREAVRFLSAVPITPDRGGVGATLGCRSDAAGLGRRRRRRVGSESAARAAPVVRASCCGGR